MGIFRRKSAPQVTREQAMSGRPVRNSELEVTRNDVGEVSIRIPRRQTWWLNMMARFGSVPDYQTLTLDRVGSSVWDLCDGGHTVRDLIGRLADEHQLSRKEAELSMITYLRQLAQRGVVGIAIDREDGDSDETT